MPPAIVKTWTGDEWQEFVDLLLHRHYRVGEYQRVPDRDRGDAGIEGFGVVDGTAYQCYAPEGLNTVSELLRKQRKKLNADLKKFRDNKDRLGALFGSLKIRRWIFIVPEFDSSQLVAHAETKAQEIRDLDLPYVAPDFRVIVVTDDAFATEREALRSGGLLALSLELPPPDDNDIEAWTQASRNSELLRTLDDKASRCITDQGERPGFVRELLNAYLGGTAVLSHLSEHFPEVFRAASSIKRTREQILRLQSAAGQTNTSLQFHLDQMADELRAAVAGLSPSDANKLALEALADWMMRCPLNFPRR